MFFEISMYCPRCLSALLQSYLHLHFLKEVAYFEYLHCHLPMILIYSAEMQLLAEIHQYINNLILMMYLTHYFYPAHLLLVLHLIHHFQSHHHPIHYFLRSLFQYRYYLYLRYFSQTHHQH